MYSLYTKKRTIHSCPMNFSEQQDITILLLSKKNSCLAKRLPLILIGGKFSM